MKTVKTDSIGWHALWFVPLALFSLFMTEHHTISLAWTLTKLLIVRWHWFGLMTPCFYLVIGTLWESIIWPVQGLLLGMAILGEQSRGRARIVIAMACVVLVLALPFVTDTLLWGSFPFTFDKQGYGRIRFIPFVPWPSGGYGAY